MQAFVGPPLESGGRGRDRLQALCEGFLSYVERRVFPGGCLFVAPPPNSELGRGAYATALPPTSTNGATSWSAPREAIQAGELANSADPVQLAFELATILAGKNIVVVLHDDNAAIGRAQGDFFTPRRLTSGDRAAWVRCG